jgi:hypothetical protein
VPYLLDGNNLIGQARRTARPSEEDRASLIRELCDRLRRTRARAVLYFDGAAPRRGADLGGLRVRFSGSVSADDAILREISKSPAPGEIVLVTADRGLARRARDAGARTLDPDGFWRRFGAASEEPVRADSVPVDVEDWLRYFEDEKNRG